MTTGTGAPLARDAEWPAGRQAGDRTDDGGRREDTRGSWQTISGGEVRGQDAATAVGGMASGRAWQRAAETPAWKAREAGVPNAEVGVHTRTWGESSGLTADTDAGGKGKDVTLGSVASTKQDSSGGPGKVTFSNSGEKGQCRGRHCVRLARLCGRKDGNGRKLAANKIHEGWTRFRSHRSFRGGRR